MLWPALALPRTSVPLGSARALTDWVVGRTLAAPGMGTEIFANGVLWVVNRKDGGFTGDGHGTIRINAYMVDVATAQVEHTASAEGKQANLAALIGQLSEHLGHDMHLADLPREGKRAREVTQKASYSTTLLFARAIEARDAGRVQQAITMLKQLLADEPEYEPALNELTRLRSDRGR